MEDKLDSYVTAYFNDAKSLSLLVTKTMELYLTTEQDEIKLGCLELLYKMKG